MRFLVLIILFTLSTPAHAGQVIPGPVLCDVERVVDGDTFDCSVSPALHKKQVGDAVWVYLLLLKISDPKTGAGGSKINHLVKQLGDSRSTIKRQLSKLRKGGYIATQQIQHGFEFEILKPVDLDVHYRIRVLGVDTPEHRSLCLDAKGNRDMVARAQEKQIAKKARDYLVSLIEGRQVYLMDIQPLKYVGRDGARVNIAGTGDDLTDLIIKAGHGRPYQGGPRRGWCSTERGATGEPPKGGE